MIRISTKLDYAIILMRSLAQHASDGPVSLRVIAAENKLPYRYLGQIAARLKHAHLIVGTEGVNGGYRLCRAPSKISLHDISTVIEPHKQLTRCIHHSGISCALADSCALSPWWQKFEKKYTSLLTNVTLAELL